MLAKNVVVFLAALSAIGASAQTTVPRMGLTLTKSTKLKPGDYLVPSTGDETGAAAIVIKGDNLTIDLAGVVLRGTPAITDPDKRKGVGVEVIGNNVTIKNAVVRGYKIALIARNAKGLKILDSDFSYNWKQKLLSTQERENGADWMSYHHNEKDEWLRYGAGIYLRGCVGFEVKGTRIVGSQCGLMLTSCSRGLVWNNDFSFNSGLGIGLYRSSDNRIMHNRVDWDVRGFSYGVYNRGQDSAGILVFEQCMRNTLAYNSVTHGGDGFFLWAGQTTMDDGSGGCNDNLLYGNDFSHAPTNGIEATFSRNTFAANLILECWHGVWGGYSYNTPIVGNIFGYNTEAIAIEHGQNNKVQGNAFYRDGTAIHLWQNQSEDPSWGYGKHRDTKSHGYDISGNLFTQITQGAASASDPTDRGALLRVKVTSDLSLGPNQYGPVGTVYDVRGPLKNFSFAGDAANGWKAVHADELGTGWDAEHEGNLLLRGKTVGMLPPASSLTAGRAVVDPKEYASRFVTTWNPLKDAAKPVTVQGKSLTAIPDASRKLAPKPLPGGQNPFLKPDAMRGWRYIIVDEWGPYDFRRPLLWPREELSPGTRRYEILGPKGTWRLVKADGAKLSATTGTVPGFVEITMDSQKATNTNVTLEYRGERTVDVKGVVTPAGTPVRFGYSRFFAPIDWNVRIFPWTKSTDPNEPHAVPEPTHYKEVTAGTAVAQRKTDRLDFGSSGAFLPGGPADKFATVADGTFEIDPGSYILDVTTDDGVRIWVDDKLVLDEWHYQGPTPYEVPLKLGGKHKIHVEHFEIDGYSALQVAIRPAK